MSSRKETPITPGVSFVLPDLPHTPSNIHVSSSNAKATSNANLKGNANANVNANATPSNEDRGSTSTYSSHRTNTNTNTNPRSKIRRESNIRLHRNLLATPAALNMTVCDTSHVGEDNSLMLLPPSQTINDSLTALAHSTSRELEIVWDEIGLSPEERADQLTDLLLNFRSACEQKVKSEREVADSYRQMIVSYKEEIRATSLALKVEADEALLRPRAEPGGGNGNAKNNGNGHGHGHGHGHGNNQNQLTLQDEVYTLEVALEDLRNVAQVAQKELTRCRGLLAEYHEALGIPMEQHWTDITSDMTKPRIEQFQAKVEEMEAVVSTRSSAVVQLIRDCQELIDAMCIPVDTDSGPGIDRNTATSCTNCTNDLDRKIMQSLIKDEDGNIKIVSMVETDDCTGISANSLDALTKRVSELHAEKRRRKAKLTEMGNVIAGLWEKLHVTYEEQIAFNKSINGLGMDTLAKGEEELQRLFQMKEAMMGGLIADCRKRIQELWKETNATNTQMAVFEPYMTVQDETMFNDDLLSEHEKYVFVLEQRLEQMKPILDMIAKREVVIEERMQYEEFLQDSDRLKQRGAALTRQLMKEEKMSRRIKKDLPKYTEVITRKLKEWANAHDEPFLYNGEDYLEVMNCQETQWQEYKENQAMMKRKKKQQERTVYTATSSSTSSGYQPKTYGSKTTATAPLADKTNKTKGGELGGPTEKSKKGRTFSRLRAMSRTRERGGNGGGGRGKSAEPTARGNPSRGKTRGNTSRTRGGFLSRGRSRPMTHN